MRVSGPVSLVLQAWELRGMPMQRSQKPASQCVMLSFRYFFALFSYLGYNNVPNPALFFTVASP